jgi:predicted metal-dependent phosphoesterase TrpH
MHNHTAVSSSCSRLSAEELIVEARLKHLDAVCVTEHAQMKGAELAQAIGRQMNFPVFKGIEARTDLGDMLIYGFYNDIPDGVPLDELCSRVTEAGGVIFAAHPFHTRGGWNLYTAVKQLGLNLEEDWKKLEVLKKLTGFEIINGNVDNETNSLARTLALNLGLPGIAGSDAHARSMVGKAATRFRHIIRTESDLVQALKKGDFEAVRLWH